MRIIDKEEIVEVTAYFFRGVHGRIDIEIITFRECREDIGKCLSLDPGSHSELGIKSLLLLLLILISLGLDTDDNKIEISGSDYRDSRDIIGTVPMMFREGMSFLKSNLRHLQAGQNFNSVGKLEIPEVVLEELLQNALVHVDLLGSAYIRLLIFDNRIEIINPGSLFGGLTVEDIRLGKSKQRNQLMSDFCARTMIYRGLGSGIPRVLKEDAKIDFVSDDNTGDFKTIIWRDTELVYLEEGSEKNGELYAVDGQLNGDNGQLNEKEGASNDSDGQLNEKIGTLAPDNGQLKVRNGQLNESQAATLAFITNHEGCNTTGIAEGLSKPFRTIDKHVRVLLQLGLIERRGSKKTGGYFLVRK